MPRRNRHNSAWGLEIGGSVVRLARVSRRDAGFIADRYHEAQIPGRWSAASSEDAGSQEPFDKQSLDEALAAVKAQAGLTQGQPLAACISDESVLYRRLTLPDVDTDALERMVRVQAEATLPLPAERMAWGWGVIQRGKGEQSEQENGGVSILLCAARQDALAPLTRHGAPFRSNLITTSALAAGGGIAALVNPSEDRIAVIDIAARCTSMGIIGGGPTRRIEHVGVADHGSDDWIEAVAGATDQPVHIVEQAVFAPRDPATRDPYLAQSFRQALNLWQHDLRNVYRKCVDELPGPGPTGCVIVGRGGRLSAVREAAIEGLGLSPIEPTSSRLSLEGLEAEASRDAAIPAAGAALHLLAPPTPTIALPGAGATEDRRRKIAPFGRAGRMIAAAAVIIAAVLGWYALDLRRAAKLEKAVAELQTETSTGRTMRSLAIGEYLQDRPTPPLLVLEAISRKIPQRVVLDHWRYDGQGHLRISGAVKGIKALDEMLTALTGTPPLKDVALRSAHPHRREWTFEIEAKVMPLHRYIALSKMRQAQKDEHKHANVPSDTQQESNS